MTTTTTRVGPIEEPITLDEAKRQCRIDYDAEDALIQGYVSAAREHAEVVTRRTLAVTTWEHVRPSWGGRLIRLPQPPLIEVESVSYVAPDGEVVDLAPDAYRWSRTEPALLMPAPGREWPATADVPDAIRIRYRAGYEDGIPLAARQAILLMVGHWYEHREAAVVGTTTSELPMAVDRLLWGVRIYEVT